MKPINAILSMGIEALSPKNFFLEANRLAPASVLAIGASMAYMIKTKPDAYEQGQILDQVMNLRKDDSVINQILRAGAQAHKSAGVHPSSDEFNPDNMKQILEKSASCARVLLVLSTDELGQILRYYYSLRQQVKTRDIDLSILEDSLDGFIRDKLYRNYDIWFSY